MQCYSGKTTRTIQLRAQIKECKTTATQKGSDLCFCFVFDHPQFYIGFRVQVIQYKTLMGLSQRYLKGGEKREVKRFYIFSYTPEILNVFFE